jgi:hypothetical protein
MRRMHFLAAVMLCACITTASIIADESTDSKLACQLKLAGASDSGQQSETDSQLNWTTHECAIHGLSLQQSCTVRIENDFSSEDSGSWCVGCALAFQVSS